MAKVNGQRGKKKADRDAKSTKDMQAAAAGEAPRLNLPQPKDLKHHYNTIMGYKAKMDEASGHLRNAYKQAEECGIDTAAIRMAMSKSKKDPMVMRNFYAQLIEHMKEQGQPFQLMIFDTAKGTPDEQAYRAGYETAKGGHTRPNPYPPGSKPHKRWARGHAHATGEHLGQTNEQVDAALGPEDGTDTPAAEEQKPEPTAQDVWPDDKLPGETADTEVQKPN
jgi:hypothetical protein